MRDGADGVKRATSRRKVALAARLGQHKENEQSLSMTSISQSTLKKPKQVLSNGDRAYRVLPATHPETPFVFLCDHATNKIPSRYKNLGLNPEQLSRHIAYDPGAAEVTEQLATHFGATAIFSCFSRLLIDPNRGEDDPTLLMRIADGAVVPGNRTIDAEERERRLATFYWPYHNAITKTLDDKIAHGITPILISIHSFTETWRGTPRPWHVGVLWAQDPRVARPIIDALAQNEAWVVGDNAPYSGELDGDTMWRHGTERKIPHALIELRQDLIRTEKGQKEWADTLIRVLEDARPVFQNSHDL